MTKEKLIQRACDALTMLIDDHYEEMSEDMKRLSETLSDDQKFKFPITIPMVIVPAGDNSTVDVGIGWSMKKKYTIGPLLIEDDPQLDIFDCKSDYQPNPAETEPEESPYFEEDDIELNPDIKIDPESGEVIEEPEESDYEPAPELYVEEQDELPY